jgi:hypothetical protein
MRKTTQSRFVQKSLENTGKAESRPTQLAATWQDQTASLHHARSSHDSESSIFINDPKKPGLQLLRAARNVAGNDKGRLNRIGQ